jgi:hypothetical protein
MWTSIAPVGAAARQQKVQSLCHDRDLGKNVADVGAITRFGHAKPLVRALLDADRPMYTGASEVAELPEF